MRYHLIFRGRIVASADTERPELAFVTTPQHSIVSDGQWWALHHRAALRGFPPRYSRTPKQKLLGSE